MVQLGLTLFVNNFSRETQSKLDFVLFFVSRVFAWVNRELPRFTSAIANAHMCEWPKRESTHKRLDLNMPEITNRLRLIAHLKGC